MSKRTLTLNAERLSELSPGELGAVQGGASIAQFACVSGGRLCRPSDLAISLCECLTQFCGSIDVC